MKIDKVIETEEGTYKLTGELNEEESRYVVEVGLNTLLQQGMFPMKAVSEEEFAILAPGSEEKQ